MKKKIAILLTAIVMLTAVFLFAGCNQPNNSNKGDTVNSGDEDGGKLTIPLKIWLKNFEKKEFGTEEDVTIELCFGARWSKQDFDRRGISHVDVVAESYPGKPQDVNWDTPDVKVLLLQVEDFYAENYPFPTTGDKYSLAPSSSVTLSKNLFVGTDGLIIIRIVYLGLSSYTDIWYKVDGEKIILGKYNDIYNTSDSQLEIS